MQSAIHEFIAAYPSFCDSLFSVTQRQTRFYDQLGRAINHNPDILLKTQELPPVYEENSCLYIFTRASLETRRNRIGSRPKLFNIAEMEAMDIDTEFEFKTALAMASQMNLSRIGERKIENRVDIGLPPGVKKEESWLRPVASWEPASQLVVVITAPHIMAHLDRFVPLLQEFGCRVEVADVAERMVAEDILKWAGKFDGTICGDDKYSADVIRACCPRLKVISKWGTGIDSIDQVAAKESGVMVGNTPGAFTNPVSDSVLAYILQFCRQQVWMDQQMKAGRWHKIAGRSLGECTVGVVGVGAIGRAVMRKCAVFGCKLLGFDPVQPPPAFVEDVGCEMTSLESLLERSDFVTINCLLTENTEHLIDEARIAMMKSTAVLINTARGPIVKETALLAALVKNSIAGCALDGERLSL